MISILYYTGYNDHMIPTAYDKLFNHMIEKIRIWPKMSYHMIIFFEHMIKYIYNMLGIIIKYLSIHTRLAVVWPTATATATWNRNLTTATPKMGSKFCRNCFIKSLHFLLGRSYVNTNSLKSFKFLRKVNLHCRKCKNVHNSLLKQIFCKVLSLNKTSGFYSYISNAISKVCTSLA